jgi:transcriptional regulator of arginine metabolism
MTTTTRALATPAARRALVLELVGGQALHSQEELRLALRRMGIRVTQATLSRDIRELGIGKAGGRYVAPDPAAALQPPDPPPHAEDVLSRVLAEHLVSAERADQVVVLKTAPGKAHATAVEIDRARWKGLLGTVAGDDTIIGIARSPLAARTILDRVKALLH